jgi:hypothetical protein
MNCPCPFFLIPPKLTLRKLEGFDHVTIYSWRRRRCCWRSHWRLHGLPPSYRNRHATLALILGAVGLILGSAGGYILRTLSALLVYVILLGVLAYFFRDQIELLTGIDPVESAITIFNDCLDLIRGEIAERRVE